MNSVMQYEMVTLIEPINNETLISHAISSLGLFSRVFFLIFLAELGDRSQISIILLAASKNLIGTIIGNIFLIVN